MIDPQKTMARILEQQQSLAMILYRPYSATSTALMAGLGDPRICEQGTLATPLHFLA